MIAAIFSACLSVSQLAAEHMPPPPPSPPKYGIPTPVGVPKDVSKNPRPTSK